LKAANCDVVMASLVVRDGASAVLERQKIGWDVDVFVAQSSTGAGMLALSGKAAEGIYGIQTSLPISAIADKPLVAEIAARFKQEYGKPMDEAVLSGYMSVLMFTEIARRAGRDLTVDGFVRALDTISNYDMGLGVPPITFTPQQRLGSKRVIVLQVRDGKWQEAGVVN
jgi:ABC-type branched-subunit amino acid transport system substrate-binding protein